MISNTLETTFCLDALVEALGSGHPQIFNTDQEAQFTSPGFTERLQAAHVRVSMDGRGRILDNMIIERLWRSVKYEDVYLRRYSDGHERRAGLAQYFELYNERVSAVAELPNLGWRAWERPGKLS